MKLKKDFVLRRLADCNVVLSIGEGAANFNQMTTLNETGRFLWEQLQTEKTIDQLVAALQEEYEVDEQTAYQHVQAFTNKLKEEGYLE